MIQQTVVPIELKWLCPCSIRSLSREHQICMFICRESWKDWQAVRWGGPNCSVMNQRTRSLSKLFLEVKTALTSYLKGSWAIKTAKIPDSPVVSRCSTKPHKCQVLIYKKQSFISPVAISVQRISGKFENK